MQLCIFEQWCDPGCGAPTHLHAVEEILTIVDGEAEVWLDDERSPMTAGQSLVVPAGRKHGFRNTGDGTLHVQATLAAPIFEAAFDDAREVSRRWLPQPRHERNTHGPDSFQDAQQSLGPKESSGETRGVCQSRPAVRSRPSPATAFPLKPSWRTSSAVSWKSVTSARPARCWVGTRPPICRRAGPRRAPARARRSAGWRTRSSPIPRSAGCSTGSPPTKRISLTTPMTPASSASCGATTTRQPRCRPISSPAGARWVRPPTTPGRAHARPTTSRQCGPISIRHWISAASSRATWAPTSTSPTR